MARVKKNILAQGLSGMLGKTIVFRQVGDETIATSRPVRNGELSVKQKAQQAKFTQAVQYANGQMADPTAKAEYALAKDKLFDTSFNIAVADFLGSPSVQEIDTIAYKGKVGDKIRVRAVDDFKVASLLVQVLKADNTVAEQGQAVQQANKIDWVYMATTAITALTGFKVVASAKDKPGKSASQTKTL